MYYKVKDFLLSVDIYFVLSKFLYFKQTKNGFLAFSYPPFVALAYYPLSLFGYRISYIIHSLLMVSALVLTIQLIRPFNPLIDQYKLSALALSLSFYPLFRAIWGGQNTAVILLLIVGTWRMALAHREWLAGIILGLLLFKPQFAIPLIGLFVLSGRWRVGLGSALTAVVLYSTVRGSLAHFGLCHGLSLPGGFPKLTQG
jgi:hypothetical protein